MLEHNKLIINGKSTADLPFYAGVQINSAPAKAIKKDKLFESDYISGIARQSVNAYSLIEKPYNIYLHDVDYVDLREFKSFIADTGWFTPFDEPDVRYVYESVVLDFNTLDAVNGYECIVTFTCQPFGYLDEVTKPLGSEIYNHTNAPMYPHLEIHGQTGSETFLQIGNQRMTFKEVQDVIYIECKPHYQDVWSSGGRKINHETKGEFFEINPGTHEVTHGAGINNIMITERWAWR